MLVYQDGITRTIDDNQWQKYKSLGFTKVEEVEDEKGEDDEKPKKTTKAK